MTPQKFSSLKELISAYQSNKNYVIQLESVYLPDNAWYDPTATHGLKITMQLVNYPAYPEAFVIVEALGSSVEQASTHLMDLVRHGHQKDWSVLNGHKGRVLNEGPFPTVREELWGDFKKCMSLGFSRAEMYEKFGLPMQEIQPDVLVEEVPGVKIARYRQRQSSEQTSSAGPTA